MEEIKLQSSYKSFTYTSKILNIIYSLSGKTCLELLNSWTEGDFILNLLPRLEAGWVKSTQKILSLNAKLLNSTKNRRLSARTPKIWAGESSRYEWRIRFQHSGKMPVALPGLLIKSSSQENDVLINGRQGRWVQMNIIPVSIKLILTVA